jgi:hypothetical protein
VKSLLHLFLWGEACLSGVKPFFGFRLSGAFRFKAFPAQFAANYSVAYLIPADVNLTGVAKTICNLSASIGVCPRLILAREAYLTTSGGFTWGLENNLLIINA